MHIILTHEQADFDALASLLGAHLVWETALPVLPRRMNRNLRAFLTLYGEDLPFIDPRDLPNKAVELVTLVDTQSLVSVKGMSPKTLVHVIDHHPLREGLPEEWSVTTEELGATTTLLVEAWRERNGGLTPVQATLLLLGIYEDTGSLTYTRTTARDLQAAAYLIEHGASLQIAGNFLNHPLSNGQQALYEHLRREAEFLHIHGHAVVLASGDAQEMDEELSTLAHKLRDLLDPDALFLLVKTRGGVQLVARSTSDNIDVSAVAAIFGGGGHERAAACLIRGRELENIREELLASLPEHVLPAVTVAQIMSRGPQLLSPSTPLEDAAGRMRRYGYEGYPVVEHGKIIGLLTRRAVDRAISHKLNLTAEKLMDAGNFSVQPHDSIETLQRTMTDSGWGQIPVIDPQTQEVIGIVTRTDLLKTLTPEPIAPGRMNLAERLERALSHGRLELLRTIAAAAHKQGAALYIVGGFVRDLLLERPSADFDLVVEGDAIKLARELARRYGGRVTSHARFGTAQWRLDGASAIEEPLRSWAQGMDSIDLVSARTEFYTHPTALPTVERGSIKLDLHRRDFTINTLALRLDGHFYGQLQDHWGGLSDLRSKLVRVLHSLSFVDDPTRILRAVRFEQRFGFNIEERTMQLLQEARPLIDRLSGDRIRHELNHILNEESVAKIMGRLASLSLLGGIYTDIPWDTKLAEVFAMLPSAAPDHAWKLGDLSSRLNRLELAYALWFTRLSPEVAARVARRFKLSAALRREVLAACELWRVKEKLVSAQPSEIVNLLNEYPPTARYAVYLLADHPQIKGALQDYTLRWQSVQPSIDGEDLKALGLPPGPIYRQILGSLRDAWLNGEISDKEGERNLLSELLRNLQDRP